LKRKNLVLAALLLTVVFVAALIPSLSNRTFDRNDYRAMIDRLKAEGYKFYTMDQPYEGGKVVLPSTLKDLLVIEFHVDYW
jgi:hypothetical protein